MNLSLLQTTALDKIMAWYKDDSAPQYYVLAGYAGAGKSTLGKEVEARVQEPVYNAALTGKAANVMREKGYSNVSTIHGGMYKRIQDKEGEPQFTLDYDSIFGLSGLLIIDEYSMLPEEILKDLYEVSNKILFMGDPFQLPPVSGNCSLKPDFFLDEIHRQALDSPIIRYASDVRKGEALKFCVHPEFEYRPRGKIDPDRYEEVDQVLVGYNKTRVAFNHRFREKQGFGEMLYPVKGDKLICLKNNHVIGLFNGMLGEASNDCTHVGFQELRLDFDDFKGLQVWNGDFKLDPKPPQGINKKFNRFDYGYAITVHKSQGSEFDDVLIYNQPIGDNATEKRRHLYTAITRGKKRVTLVQP